MTFSWANVRGILVFPGTQASEGQILQLDNRLKATWPGKVITYNVCSEVAEWEQTPWADGPPAHSQENLENLERFLRVTAAAGSQVYLNIFCTVRDNHGWMNQHGEQYAKTVGEMASEYNHVLLSIANEPYHPNSWFRQNLDARLRRMRDAARMAGFQGPMGADDNIGCPGCSFVYGFRGLGFDANFHPYRNPNPSKRALERIAEENGGWAVITEPTAYSSWREGGCCTADREEIRRYKNQAEAAGLVWFFHSTNGLSWPAVVAHFEWIPED